MFTISGDIVTPTHMLENGALVIDDAGQIAEIQPRRASPPRSGDIAAEGQWILPGFIDMHIHGGGGSDFMEGTPEAVHQVARTHARFGTTSLLATTLTAARAEIDQAVRSIRDVMEQERPADEAQVLGIHLEGPYICPVRCGAQPKQHIRLPDCAELAHWQELSHNSIRQVTMAPEEPGAEELVRLARSAGIIVSLGHTNATAEQALAAIGWGAAQGTHIFNAMPPLHHRKPGVAGAVLACPEIIAEVIADGVHLHPLMVRLVLSAKGPAGAVLITDAIQGAAMPDGTYALGGHPVSVHQGKASFADGTLAGSVLTMNKALMNILEYTGLPLPIAAGFASTNAARQLGLLDRIGSLEIGKQADIAILQPKNGQIAYTLIAGKAAFCH